MVAAGFFAVTSGSPISRAQDTGLNDEETRTLLELNSEINEKKKAIDELQEKSDLYQRTLDQKERETLDLSNQVSIIENQILKTETDLQQQLTEIEKTNLEIRQIEGLIELRTSEIENQQGRLAEAIRLVYRHSRKTYLEIALQNDSLSEFFIQAKGIQELEQKLKDSVDELVKLKQALEQEHQNKVDKQTALEETTRNLEQNQIAYEQEKIYRETLISQTESQKAEYEDLLDEAQTEANRVTSEVSALESRFRQKLEEQAVDLNKLLQDVGELGWPVPPLKGISAYFHDPSYPYRKYFEHPAIDIPTPQGTPVKAAADGLVSIARNINWTTDRYGRRIPAYNYVSILHGSQLSTVYGHLNAINVTEEQYVRRGEVIGLSGGTPGTAGAGLLTTGAHLHFEVRLNGIPQDPLSYLK